MAPAVVQRFQITRFEFPRGRPIGDSQVRADMHYTCALELFTEDGLTGLGFFGALFHPLPARAELERQFAAEVFPGIAGQSAFALLNRQGRPRGGNIRGTIFGQAVDQALWDLQGKSLGMPLFRLLGASRERVRAYASGLEFHLPTDQAQRLFADAKARGFSAFKLKVGHPDLAWDLARISAVTDAIGRDALLMVDANEAWSPKEAVRRAYAYRDAGFNIYWIEDPCLRDDFAGLARVAQEVTFCHINAGEYLDLRGKRLLMEHRAVDILNVHGHISDTLRAGWLAAEHGIPISLGNTPFELGVHLAAALPEAQWLEYSFQDYDVLVERPVQFEGGYAIPPDGPGLGLALSEAARRDLARPEVGR